MEITSLIGIERGMKFRDGRGKLWRTGAHAHAYEIDEAGTRLKRDTYERVGNLLYLYPPLTLIEHAEEEA